MRKANPWGDLQEAPCSKNASYSSDSGDNVLGVWLLWLQRKKYYFIKLGTKMWDHFQVLHKIKGPKQMMGENAI